ncbi:MAG: LLM class flavin-dependent oxidoreductase [Candidatus Tectomicrobia bacterium]|nr:LLM class flavin-dependent oxidoreductase [Candidatus Tectomicrobia bacterium]
MTSHSVSIAFQTDKPITAYGPLAEAVEQYGFSGVTVYNDMLYQPAWLPLLEIARHTRRVRIGPAAVNPFTSHPINIAGNIALIDEMSQGRAYLGLARGGWLDFLGLHPERPITALREAFACIRLLLRQSTEPYHGQVFSLAGGEALRWRIHRPDVPFLLGTWGSQTLSACLTQIAEVKIGGTANPGVVPAIQTVIGNATTQDRDTPADIRIAVGAVTIVDRDGKAARDAARREAALYLNIIARLDPTLGIEPDLLSRIHDASAQYDFEQVGRYISDDILRRVAFAGTPDEVAEQAANLFDSGVQRVEFGTPHGLTTAEGLRLLGKFVLPALR